MSVTSVGHFVSLLQQSNLLTNQQLDVARAELAIADAGQLPVVVERFAERGWLTLWQARMLLAGRHTFFLGRYKLLDHLGEGGMGSVFKAEQTPLGRLVAIKTLRKDLVSSPDMVARFHREIHAAASLSHPNIVAAYDADCVAGRHFLVMEYVEGRDLSALLKGGRKLPVGEACEYVRQAAIGLAHAHERGMIHRDIKPSNLLLKAESQGSRVESWNSGTQPSTLDSRPVVKILDMGLARIAHGDGEQTELTHTGQVMGTPDYISPEQARDSKTADARSDIYSLGCTLYRLLTGRVPFQGGSAIEKITARLVDEPPPLRLSVPHAPAELEAICLKLMARDPKQRYQTASEVAAALAPFAAAPLSRGMGDVSRESAKPQADVSAPVIEPGLNEFLQHLASEAAQEEEPDTGTQNLDRTQPSEQRQASGGRQPPVASDQSHASLAETAAWNPDGPQPAGLEKSAPAATRAGRKLRDEIAARNRADRRRMLLILSSVALFVAVVAGIVGWQKAGETLLIVDWPLDERKGAKLEVDGREVSLANSADLRFSGPPGKRRVRLTRDGYEPFEASFDLARAETKPLRPEWKPTPATVRQHEWTALKRRVDAWASGGRQAPVAPDDSSVVALREALVKFRRQHYGTPQAILAAAQMSRLPWPVDMLKREMIDPYEFKAAGKGDAANAPAKLVAILGDSRLKHWGPVHSVAFSPDGGILASSSADETVILWDPTTGQRIGTLLGHRMGALSIAFSPDGKTLAVGCADGVGIRLWDVTTRQAITEFNVDNGIVHSVAYSPDGRILAAGNDDHSVRLWDAVSGKLLETLRGHQSPLWYAGFSSSGLTLVTADVNSTIIVWDRGTSGTMQRARLRLAEEVLWSAALSTDGTSLAVACQSGTGWLVDLTGPELHPRQVRPSGSTAVAFSRDGKTLCIGIGGVSFWNIDGPRAVERAALKGRHSGRIAALAFDPNGQTLASASDDGTIKLWDVVSGKERRLSSGHSAWVWSIACAPDGHTLASSSADHSIKLWDLATGKDQRTLSGHEGEVITVAFSPDGRSLASASYDQTVKLWDTKTGRERRTLAGHMAAVESIAFRPDGRTLASGSSDRTIKLWNVETRQEGRELSSGHSIHWVAFSPDGRTLASARRDHPTIKLWDAESGKERRTLSGHSTGTGVYSVAFSPDGRSLASGSSDTTIKLWDADAGRERRTLSGHTGMVESVVFSPDGRSLVSSAHDGTVKFWRPFAEREAEPVTIPIGPPGGRIVDVAFTPDGRHIVTANGNGTVYVLRLKEWSAK